MGQVFPGSRVVVLDNAPRNARRTGTVWQVCHGVHWTSVYVHLDSLRRGSSGPSDRFRLNEIAVLADQPQGGAA